MLSFWVDKLKLRNIQHFKPIFHVKSASDSQYITLINRINRKKGVIASMVTTENHKIIVLNRAKTAENRQKIITCFLLVFHQWNEWEITVFTSPIFTKNDIFPAMTSQLKKKRVKHFIYQTKTTRIHKNKIRCQCHAQKSYELPFAGWTCFVSISYIIVHSYWLQSHVYHETNETNASDGHKKKAVDC